MTEKVIILGSGPAGYTAAIYSARAGLNPLIIEGSDPGGQLMLTTLIENYPGFPNGIMGPALMDAMRQQTKSLGARIISGHVEMVELKKRPFKIVAGGSEYLSESLIIATGAASRWLGLASEAALRGKGVSSCATCDGFFFKGEDVVVVGGGDTAMEDAIYLSRLVKSVTIVHRRDKLRASQAMQERVLKNPKISFVWNSIVVDIKDASAGKVTSIVLKDVSTGKVFERPCGGVFVAVGHDPNTALFKGQLTLDKNGYIVTKVPSTTTNIAGVFAAGDCCDPVYKQAVTAAGSGCQAALDAEKWLASQ